MVVEVEEEDMLQVTQHEMDAVMEVLNRALLGEHIILVFFGKFTNTSQI